MEKNWTGANVELNWCNTPNVDVIIQELLEGDWVRLFAGKGCQVCGRLLNVRVRIQGQNVCIRVSCKAGRNRER